MGVWLEGGSVYGVWWVVGVWVVGQEVGSGGGGGGGLGGMGGGGGGGVSRDP